MEDERLDVGTGWPVYAAPSLSFHLPIAGTDKHGLEFEAASCAMVYQEHAANSPQVGANPVVPAQMRPVEPFQEFNYPVQCYDFHCPVMGVGADNAGTDTHL